MQLPYLFPSAPTCTKLINVIKFTMIDLIDANNAQTHFMCQKLKKHNMHGLMNGHLDEIQLMSCQGHEPELT